jgi:hypothetical protein
MFSAISRFVVVIIVGAVVASSPLAYAEDTRQVWEHTRGLFKDQGNGVWVETDPHGALWNKFLEVDRTGEFVQLYDSSRDYAIRLHSAALYIKGGKGPGVRKFDDWTKLMDGKWVLAPKPSPTSVNGDVEPPPFITVMPVFFVPTGEKQPTEDQMSRFMRHLQIAQKWYKEALGNRDTFTIAKDIPEIIQGKHPTSHYKTVRPFTERGCPYTGETLDHLKLNRYNCPYVFTFIVMNPREDYPGAWGVTLNGGVNLGGGVAMMSSFILDTLKFFQGVLMHEMGHSFGLQHPKAYGYSMNKIPNTIMAANNTFDGWSGFKPPSGPSILLPEDIRLLSWNHRVFPKLVFDPSQDVPTGYRIGRPMVFPPLAITGHPSYEPSIDKRK